MVRAQGGPKTNYEVLFTNLELWNVITFKLESLKKEFYSLDDSIYIFDLTKERLIKEL